MARKGGKSLRHHLLVDDSSQTLPAKGPPAAQLRRRNLALLFAAGALYYLLGLFMYMGVVETWSLTDAAYFITITFTTVGFVSVVFSSA